MQAWGRIFVVSKASLPTLPKFSSHTVRAYSILGNLQPAEGSNREGKRVGRGPGSGKGKTSGRGQKGQKARSKVKSWFEGGQTPIYKLFPKRGFNSHIPELQYLNLGRLQELIDASRIDASKPISMRELYRSRYFSTLKHGVKILADGAENFTAKVDLSASAASEAAISKIEQLGGSFTAEFYTKQGLRALTKPEVTLRKYGRIPLRARPIDRKSILYYRNPDKRGYLRDTPGAPQMGYTKRKTDGDNEKKYGTALEAVLEKLEARA